MTDLFSTGVLKARWCRILWLHNIQEEVISVNLILAFELNY